MVVGVAWLERFQVPLYIAALLAGALIGLQLPAIAGPAEAAINPSIALLLYITFLAVPFGRIGRSLTDWRFMLTVLVLNFVVVPAVVFGLTRIIAGNQVLLVGVLFVLLAPCIDYVIVFTGLAGGASDRLLAVTPALMLLQMVLLPFYLWLLIGPGLVDTVVWAPFIGAFIWLILVPLVLAGATQLWAGRYRSGRAFVTVAAGAMVPLMMLTLAVVVASQIGGVSRELGSLLQVVPIYVAFALIMIGLGLLAGKVVRLDVAAHRAVVFSGVTRNSLVVLPLVLALPAEFALAPLVVVTQTLVELVIMVILVRVAPRLVPARAA